MEQLLKTISDEPVDMTYLGIGSCPHLITGQTLDIKNDQLVPSCFHDTMLLTNKTIRIIHIDPFFDQYQGFLQKYWKEYNLIPVEYEGAYCWVNDHIQVFILSQRIDHKDNYWFFEALSESILNTKGKLIIQEYTGFDLQELNQKLYEETSQKEKYKRRILLDMTFGTDSGCSTDMINAKPFYDSNGNFINLYFTSDSEIKRYIGIYSQLDDILKKKYIAKFYMTLNYYHVDYRRRVKGERGLYNSPDYNDSSTPDEIMSILQKKLRDMFDMFMTFGLVTKAHQETLQELFTNYKDYDPYKWYDSVYKVVNANIDLRNTVQ